MSSFSCSWNITAITVFNFTQKHICVGSMLSRICQAKLLDTCIQPDMPKESIFVLSLSLIVHVSVPLFEFVHIYLSFFANPACFSAIYVVTCGSHNCFKTYSKTLLGCDNIAVVPKILHFP